MDNALQYILCGWQLYVSVLALLMTFSAGPRTLHGRFSALAFVAAVAGVILLWWRPPISVPSISIGSAENLDPITFGPQLLVALTAAWVLLRGRRMDSRLIALLLLFAALIPLALHVCRFERGMSCFG